MQLNINDVIFREDLYPRFKPNQQIISKYVDSIDQLPPIKVNQLNILIDGFHRWNAHKIAEKLTIEVDVIETASEKELKKLAYQTNSNHGLQLTNEEKKRYAIEMVDEMSIDDISKILSIGKTTIKDWTVNRRQELKDARDQQIINLYLHASNTQEKIAEIMNVDQKTVSRIIEDFRQKAESGFLPKGNDFEPYIYNIWNLSKNDKDSQHFGGFPTAFMKNLLHYHTKPFDIVYDPFAGEGTTVDVCQEMYRRYYCSDRVVKPGREGQIFQHDIKIGLPEDLPKPDLAFLDPPYWIQAKGKYSQDDDDLANMSLDSFYTMMNSLFNDLVKRKVPLIAVVIQPTQYANDMVFEDHIFKFHEMLMKKYVIEMRYILPYSTEQYNAQMVNKAKETNACLCLNRDLVVWKLI